MQRLNALWDSTCQTDPQALAQGQKPFAALLSCADARVDPSWMAACGSGERFQLRSAGNVAFHDAIAPLETAVSMLEVPLVLVMGHRACRAVRAAMVSAPLTSMLEQLVTPIGASLQSRDDLTQAVHVQGNARDAAGQLTARSEALTQRCRRGPQAQDPQRLFRHRQRQGHAALSRAPRRNHGVLPLRSWHSPTARQPGWPAYVAGRDNRSRSAGWRNG